MIGQVSDGGGLCERCIDVKGGLLSVLLLTHGSVGIETKVEDKLIAITVRYSTGVYALVLRSDR